MIFRPEDSTKHPEVRFIGADVVNVRVPSHHDPDKLSREALVAELTNHLIADVVLSPGAIGTLPELQAAGFCYAK